jgi:hypothetical protein
MDGLYLASNLEPLKLLGEGNALKKVNDLLESDRFQGYRLAAYSIRGSKDRIVTVRTLFEKNESGTLFYRDFDLYKRDNHISDCLIETAQYGVGIGDFDLDYFIKLRDFYRQNKEVELSR